MRTLRLVALVTALGVAGCGPDACGCGPVVPPPPPPPPATGVGIHVVGAGVRACDVLLKPRGQEIPQVDFAGAVNGASIPQAPQLAVSFAAKADASLEGVEIAKLRFVGTALPADLVRAECFDKAGEPVPGDPLRLQ